MMAIFYPLSSSGYIQYYSHPLINQKALELSSIRSYLKNNLGFTKGFDEVVNGRSISRWIQQGGTDEDDNIRGLFHFHDPTKQWDSAGIWGLGFSSIDWAQDNTKTPAPSCSTVESYGISCPEPPPSSNPSRSWRGARKYYYDALTAETTIIERERNYRDTFKALGHVMHLLADAAVPAHVRNDSHMLGGSRYEQAVETLITKTTETFLKEKVNSAPSLAYSSLINAPIDANYVPIADLWDTTPQPGYGGYLGLAEYTNYNFLSYSTVFMTYPNPVKLPAYLKLIEDEGKVIGKTIYVPSVTTDSQEVKHLAAASYLYAEAEKTYPSGTASWQFLLDDKCHEEYASILVPRAVSYNAALLDYFFRGTMEISLPDDGVYAVAGPDSSFTKIRLKVTNTTTNDEAMGNGTIQAIIHYRLALADPLQSRPVDISPETSYAVSAPVPLTSLLTGSTQDITLDFSPNSIPLWATNVYAQVVFKGQLGNEDGAVAVGYKDISEPTPVDIINNMDFICLNNTLYEAGSAGATEALDEFGQKISDEVDVYRHTMKQVYVKFSSVRTSWSRESMKAHSGNYQAAFPSIASGSYGRVFILTEPYEVDTFISVNTKLEKGDTGDTTPDWLEAVLTSLDPMNGLLNQTNRTEAGNVTYFPLMNTIRGIKVFESVTYLNEDYPYNTECNYNLAPNLNGPVAVSIPER